MFYIDIRLYSVEQHQIQYVVVFVLKLLFLYQQICGGNVVFALDFVKIPSRIAPVIIPIAKMVIVEATIHCFGEHLLSILKHNGGRLNHNLKKRIIYIFFQDIFEVR